MEIVCDMRDALLFYLFYIQNFFLKVHKKNYYFSPLRSAPLRSGVHSLFSHLPDRPAQQESSRSASQKSDSNFVYYLQF